MTFIMFDINLFVKLYKFRDFPELKCTILIKKNVTQIFPSFIYLE
jgi:hypothetical protein